MPVSARVTEINFDRLGEGQFNKETDVPSQV